MLSIHRVILLGLLVTVLALAAPGRKMSNSELLARGLPLNPPKRLYDPTRTRLRARQDASAGVNDPIDAFILVEPVAPQGNGIPGGRKRNYAKREPASYFYLWDNNDGYYQQTTNTPDTWTFYPSDANKVDAGVFTTRYNMVSRKAKRDLSEGWFGFYQENFNIDVNDKDHGFLGSGLFNPPSTAAGYDDYYYYQTRIFNKPAIGEKIAITWYNAQNAAVTPNFYYGALGQDSPRVYAALQASDIDPSLTEDDQVILTWVLPENLNLSP